MTNSRNRSGAQTIFFILCIASSLLFLSSCNVLEIPGPPPDLYNLTPKSTFAPDLPDVPWQLIIEEPIAAGGLDTNRIALRPHATELKFFAGARWTERAPKMIQTLLVESFENTNKIIAVGRQSIGLRADFTLKTELREFQAETNTDNGVIMVRVRINAKIVKQPKRVIVGSKSFEHVVQVKDDNGIHNIVIAFDTASGKVLKKLVEWSLVTLK